MTVRLGDKSLFPSIEARAYLNHAAVSPPSTRTLEAIARVHADYAARGSAAFPTWIGQRERLKGKLGELIGATAAEIAVTANTTRGITDLALSIPWKQGDRVICFEGEFPANVTPWQRVGELLGLEVVRLPLTDFAREGGPDLGRLESELRRGARVVAASAVQFQTGLRMPLAAMSALAHAHGAELAVDGVQACGATPVDVRAEGIDYLASGSHKWLMGGIGAGLLFIRKELQNKLRSTCAGWLSHEEPLGFLLQGPNLLRYDRPIQRSMAIFEGGNVNDAGLAGLEASVDALLELGVPSIFAHVNALLDPLERALVDLGFRSLRSKDPARRSCVLGVLPPLDRSAVGLVAELAANGIVTSAPDGHLRFSPHFESDEDDVALAIEVVRAASK